MSRIGKKPILLTEKVLASVNNQMIEITGPKGTLSREIHPLISMVVKDNKVIVSTNNKDKFGKSLHGLYRALINNMVIGVSDGFSKLLLIHGVGYKAALQGQVLNLQLGYSHSISYPSPPGVTIEVLTPTQIKVSGIDKELVGEIAARIRAFKKPNVYKGKGIMYEDETVRKKPTKTGVKK
ncbi:50S ribosomal protein L6 [bacterium]|nr:50S ribosomal protein L6 [bacterium]MBU0899844.1 50S ribosomal protein L6 [bacterium]MBU1153616.1 50S ribosomal protein L6 [bacterium]MBU2600253.1 50S ribosomal protein L6 [bacterium]